MLAENRASFINVCQISTLGVTLSVHTSAAKRLSSLPVGPPRSMSAAGCLLMSVLSRRN